MAEREPLAAVCEAILAVAGEVVAVETLAEAAGEGVTNQEVEAALELLRSRHEGPSSGLMLERVAGGWRLATRPALEGVLRSFLGIRSRAGSVVAQLGMPDMKGPIAYALSYPDRLPDVSPGLDLASIATLTFQEPDRDLFPCLNFAYDAIRAGGSMPAVLFAANEVAVRYFLDEKIGFMDISRVLKATMDGHTPVSLKTVDDALKADQWARREAEKIIGAGVRGMEDHDLRPRT